MKFSQTLQRGITTSIDKFIYHHIYLTKISEIMSYKIFNRQNFIVTDNVYSH